MHDSQLCDPVERGMLEKQQEEENG